MNSLKRVNIATFKKLEFKGPYPYFTHTNTQINNVLGTLETVGNDLVALHNTIGGQNIWFSVCFACGYVD